MANGPLLHLNATEMPASKPDRQSSPETLPEAACSQAEKASAMAHNNGMQANTSFDVTAEYATRTGLKKDRSKAAKRMPATSQVSPEMHRRTIQ